ncbi:MAG TPA: UMP kinase [Atribacterota bacterium]|nr:UMP kinase [Atribacterota bacterium]HOR42477.1 UMP kinase [Atribacterota bacterium]HPK86726.1 UMP kinase [Atribacterota bacterium]
MKAKQSIYRRILLKLGGESFSGEDRFGINIERVNFISTELAEIKQMGIQIAIVIGGGNIFRGREASAKGINQVTADYMGMLGTVINALALQDTLEKLNIETRVLTAIEMRAIAEPYIRRRAIRHLEKGRIIILAAGTGHPFFSTDTAAALRAVELDAEAILKATKVDGIYESDPFLNKNALKFEKISFLDFLNKNLRVMDATSISLCMENKVPIIVFNLNLPGNIKKVILGESIGTIVKEG